MNNGLQACLDRLADDYLELHQRKERLFWETKMGLSNEHKALQDAELALKDFCGDTKRLAELRRWREGGSATDAQCAVLDGWIEMISRNVIEDPAARALHREIVALESELGQKRSAMPLGYVDPTSGKQVRATSIVLGNMVRSDQDESRRRAAWEGLRSVGPFALEHGFCDVVRARNRLARMLGYVDYYDYKVQWAEGFSKAVLFGLLDDLERRTARKADETVGDLARSTEADGGKPWNYAFLTSGSLAAEREPYFRFEDALNRWGRSFAALGIRFRGASIKLDLIDRHGKYENGFMHGPTPAYMRRGEWLPAEINFTSNAVPDQAGSGHHALRTLFHEGGHAAHFSNIVTDAPCFSQEFAPTSVAFAETQSMFCDSLISDADWQTRYARNENAESIPADLIERSIRMGQPGLACEIRRMLTVCYFEKALYELPDEAVTPARVEQVALDVERRLLFFDEGSPRPTLSVPHILSGDASCYYHGYVLAEMAVEQTREFFKARYGHLLDNPNIGNDLAQIYWRPGNAVRFLDYIPKLTGQALSADALVQRATRSVDEAVAGARKEIASVDRIPLVDGPVNLDLNLAVVHGAEEIVSPGGSFDEAADTFRAWVKRNWPRP